MNSGTLRTLANATSGQRESLGPTILTRHRHARCLFSSRRLMRGAAFDSAERRRRSAKVEDRVMFVS